MIRPTIPPVLAERLLKWLAPSGIKGESIVGDLREEYLADATSLGTRRARGRYWAQVFRIGVSYRGRGKQTAVLSPSARRGVVERLEELERDIRFSGRMMVRNPRDTILTVSTLALGIGASTAIYSVVHTVLIEPLPYDEPDRLVTLWSDDDWAYGTNVAEYFDIRDRQTTLTDIAVYQASGRTLASLSGAPAHVTQVAVSGGFFNVMGVPPLVGRALGPEDDVPGRAPVAVLEYEFWLRQFGGDKEIVGHTFTLDERTVSVVGVMPPNFAFPAEIKHWGPNPGVDMWLPLGPDPANPGGRGGHGLQSVARIRDGVTLERASQDIKRISIAIHEEHPGAYPTQFRAGWTLRWAPLSESIVGETRNALFLLLAAVGMVYLISVLNVTNLLLARGTAREQEIAVRAALGARSGRLVRQLLTESVMLSLTGGVIGVGLAVVVLAWLLSMAPTNIPRISETELSVAVLLFASIQSLVTGVMSGVAPAFVAGRMDLQSSIAEGSGFSLRGTGERVRQALVTVEVASTIVLLAGASMLIDSLSNLARVDLGFTAADVFSYHVTLPSDRYPSGESAITFVAQLLPNMTAQPGVRAAGVISSLPLAEDFSVAVMAEGMGQTNDSYADGLVGLAAPRAVSPGYFTVMGLTLVEGQFFDRVSREDPLVAVVSDSFAREAWPEAVSALGKRIAFPSADPQWRVVVGVVKDTREEAGNLASERYMDAYFPFGQLPTRDVFVVLKTSTSAVALAPAIRERVASLDPAIPVYDIRTMDEVVRLAMGRAIFNARIMSTLAILGLLLGGVGIYGVVSFAVSRRARETAIRISLGAHSADVVSSVVTRGMMPVLLGVAIGLPIVFGTTRFVQSLLFGFDSIAPTTLGAVVVTLVVIALLACYVPARRAAATDPVIVLSRG